jgi:FKBP-type peptidyl-prolyl cis-trans isomerase FkpA
MKSMKNILLMGFAGLLVGATLTSCSKAKYKKTAGGMPYQLFEGKDTQRVQVGDYIKIQFTQKIKDSVYFTTVGTLPQYQQVNPPSNTYDISEIWTTLKLGDSVVSTQLIDTFINRNPQSIPPQFKKGDKIMSYIKILAIFKTDSAARLDYEKSNKEWLASEIKTIEKYLADKKITAEKSPGGVFVQTLTPGTGNLIDSGKYISVKYTGISWSGVQFDSNMDTAAPPMSFTVGAPGMIPGFSEGAKLLRLGAKAKLYIPSMQAYGARPQSPQIKPYEILIFDIEVVDVKDKAPAPPATRQGAQNIDIPQPNK